MTLLAGALAWLLAAAAFNLGWSAWSAVAAAPLLALLLPARGRWPRLLHVVVAAAVAALAAVVLGGPPSPQPSSSIGHHLGEPATLLVRASGDGDRHASYVGLTATTLAREEDGEWRPASGRLTAFLPATIVVRDGDVLTMSGTLTAAGGTNAPLGYRDWLNRRNVVASVTDARIRIISKEHSAGTLTRLRDRVGSGLAAALPARDASLAFALLFGGRHALPPDMNDDLVRSGTAHLAVVSAFNLALLFGAVLALGTPLVGRRRAAPPALVAALAYGALAGATPSVLRGEIIVALLTLSLLSGRPHSRAALLVLAAAAMTLPDARLLADVAFQLTFAAAFGAALLTAPVQTLASRILRLDEDRSHEQPAAVRIGLSALALSVAVSLACLPVLAGAFGALPTYGVLGNAVVTPFVPVLMALSLVTGVAGSVLLPLARVAAVPVWLGLQALKWTIHLSARLPGAYVRTPAGGAWLAFAWYGVLAATATASTRGRGVSSRSRRATAHRSDAAIRVPLERLRRVAISAALAAMAVAAPASVVAGRRLVSGGVPSRTAVHWLQTSLGSVEEIDGANGSRALLVDGGAPSILAAVRASGGLGDRAVDATIVVRGDARYADPAPWRDAARAAHTGSVLFAAGLPDSKAGAAAAQQEDGVLRVTGSASLDLGGGDRLELLTDGSGAVSARIMVEGRYAILAGTEDARRLLDLWHDQESTDVVVLPGVSSDRERQAIADLRPSLALLTGRSASPPSAVRTIRTVETRDLTLSPAGGRLSVSYRDR